MLIVIILLIILCVIWPPMIAILIGLFCLFLMVVAFGNIREWLAKERDAREWLKKH